MELPKIAIIGGGPSGLTLARLLQIAEVPCTIFELDAFSSARNSNIQGTLDIHTATGQEALKQAGLLEKFQALSRPEGQMFKIIEPTSLRPLVTVVPPPPGEPNKPEIMRTELREMLLDSLNPDSIKWRKKLVEVKPAGPETYDLHFQDGSVEKDFDLVVGTDGAWSRVRPLVSSEVPHYSGAYWLYCNTPLKYVRQDISDLVGEGAIMAPRDRKALWAQRLTGGDIYSALILSVPLTWIDDVDIDFSDADNARKRLVEKYLENSKWSETLQQVILGSKGPLTVRPLWQLPVGWKWENRPGVTLVGDAAHVMTPFAGVGVNVAMEDSLELARAIIKRKNEGKRAMIVGAVKEYEQSMFVRAEENASLTRANMLKHLGGPSKDR